MRPRSAYIHVPFCAHRCGYCDFTLIAGRDDLIGDYLRALAREIAGSSAMASAFPVDSAETRELETLFLGGGTPTHPSCDQLQELFQIVHSHFTVTKNAEVSVEANPLDLTDDKIDVLANAGVNRISLGVQSFSPAALALLERDHTAGEIDDVIRRLRRRFANISLDLIFGVPGQSMDDWQQSLRRAIDLGPTHISTYGLTWESGTAFGTRRDRGELVPVDEELEREQYALAMDELTNAGFEHYEISNFARPGFRCRHNEVYWAGGEYWAFGPGAARYVHGRRETNIRSVLGWLSKIERGESPVADSEQLNPEHRARELIFLGLRRIDGIRRSEFVRQSGFELDAIGAAAIDRNIQRGWLEDTGSSVRLTRAGCFMADRVVADFL